MCISSSLSTRSITVVVELDGKFVVVTHFQYIMEVDSLFYNQIHGCDDNSCCVCRGNLRSRVIWRGVVSARACDGF